MRLMEAPPEGVEVIEVLSEPRSGTKESPLYWWSGALHGGYGVTLGAGTVIVRPADGFEFVFDITCDCYRITEAIRPAKILTVRFRITNEHDETRLRVGLPNAPGFISIEEADEPVTEPAPELLAAAK